MALLVVKGANLLPPRSEKYKGTIDVWWIVHILSVLIFFKESVYVLQNRENININIDAFSEILLISRLKVTTVVKICILIKLNAF